MTIKVGSASDTCSRALEEIKVGSASDTCSRTLEDFALDGPGALDQFVNVWSN